MAKKYTPGPWIVFNNDAEHPGIDDAKGDTSIILFGINDSCGVRGASKEEVEANALLISCAPELLEALEAIYNHPNIRYEVEAQIGGEVWDIIKKANGQ